jgi:hypothetical protein
MVNTLRRNQSVFEWHKQFKKEREDVQDDPGSGQRKAQRTDANVDRVRTLVSSDRRLGVRLTAEEVSMNKERVLQIMMEELGKREIAARIAPRILTDNQKCQLPG